MVSGAVLAQQARFPIPLSNRARGFPAHGSPMVFRTWLRCLRMAFELAARIRLAPPRDSDGKSLASERSPPILDGSGRDPLEVDQRLLEHGGGHDGPADPFSPLLRDGAPVVVVGHLVASCGERPLRASMSPANRRGRQARRDRRTAGPSAPQRRSTGRVSSRSSRIKSCSAQRAADHTGPLHRELSSFGGPNATRANASRRWPRSTPRPPSTPSTGDCGVL